VTLDRDRYAREAFGLAGRAAVGAFLDIAEACGAHVIAIKGLHVMLLGGDAVPRAMGDFDLVIAGRDAHKRVLAELRRLAEWEVGDDEDHSVPVRGPYGAALDLHRTPLPRHLGKLDADALLHRARPAPSPLGPRLLVPDPVDAAILSLVHYTKDRLGAFGSAHARADLELFATKGATGERIAARIKDHGLRRAALVALVDLEPQSPLFARWIAALAPSGNELRVARAAASALRSLAERAPRATWWAVRLLPDSAKQAARGLLWQARVSLGRRRIS